MKRMACSNSRWKAAKKSKDRKIRRKKGGKGNCKDKVCPRTGHEGPEV